MSACEFSLEPLDNKRLANLLGQFDEHMRLLEKSMGVEVSNRGNLFRVVGDPVSAELAASLIRKLFEETKKAMLTPSAVHLFIQQEGVEKKMAQVNQNDSGSNSAAVAIRTRRGVINVRSHNQKQYIKNIRDKDISFGIGPAGTGKTYLAVALAVEALEAETVRRLVLVRPAVEAGERLGFLPGDLSQKIDPYLRPLYDALYEMLGFERVAKLMEKNMIEVAPLAYMRGRTLNDSFVILDEAQNTTIEQMKMFLTRIGFGSVAVITGDVTQIDLPRDKRSGLRHAIEVLSDTKEIGFTFFTSSDVVRHPLVQKIVKAYAIAEKREAKERGTER